MNDEEIFECLFTITDKQAQFSDVGSTSDYEDNLPNSSLSTEKTPVLWASTNKL